jgi:general secretion pathway protein C
MRFQAEPGNEIRVRFMAKKQKSKKTAAKISPGVEARIVEVSLQHPDYGATRLLPLLEQKGITVSTSAIYTTLKRNNLQNRSLRFSKLEEQRTAEIVTEPRETIESRAKVPALALKHTSEPKETSPRSKVIKPPPKTRVRRPWLLRLANILLLGLVGYFWVSVLGNILEARNLPSLPYDLSPPVVQPRDKGTVRPLEDYNIIVERNLFGRSKEGASAPQKEESLESLPVSPEVFGLRLVGTVVGDDAAMSLAVIDNQSTRKQGLYHEGDQVGRALLKKILRNRVVVSTDNGDQLLTMEFKEDGESPKSSQRTAAGQLPETEPSGIPAEREDQDSAFFDLEEFIQQVKISPYMQGKQPAGARINATSTTLARLRLRNGDVITGANGKAITDPAQTRKVFEKAAQGEEVTLDILRRNRPRKIRIR